jgi:NTE family protein
MTEGAPKIAFVGSGGAAKGIAHLGVLKAMEEIGLAADIFVGASSGAIVGAFASQGLTADRMVDWLRPPWRRHHPQALKSRFFFGLPTLEQLRNPGYLASGLFSLDRLEKFLAEALPSNDFRSVGPTLLVTAADVDGHGRRVFGKGHHEDVPISRAIAASTAVPILFRPYRVGDRFYIDGELIRTLSIDLAVEAGADVVIVSNVYRPHVTKHDRPSLVHRGAAAVARQAVNMVFAEKEQRGIDLIHRLHPHITVLNVAPDLGRYPFTGRGHARKLLTRGYREALRVLAAAKQRGVFDVRSNVRRVGKA